MIINEAENIRPIHILKFCCQKYRTEIIHLSKQKNNLQCHLEATYFPEHKKYANMFLSYFE